MMNLDSKNTQKTVLVLGYGNPIRSDDGIGQIVAREVENWNIPNVKCLALHQLLPEVAESLSQVDLAIFVDASITGETVELLPLKPLETTELNWGHHLNPQSLLTLAKTLYHKTPEAWLISVPGVDFELGEILSETAKQGVIMALEKIKQLIN
ncbi:MAG: hydrogenase maturation protease [Lyngbya sp.]|nr:hydrogenase maturation protease [Lyngbya sp.]